MDPKQSTVEQLFQDIKAYIAAQRSLALTVISKKGADAFFIIITAGLLFSIGWFFIMFLSFALAYALGNWIGYISLGFLIVAVLYFIIGLITWMNKDRWIKTPLLKLFFKLSSADKDQDYE